MVTIWPRDGVVASLRDHRMGWGFGTLCWMWGRSTRCRAASSNRGINVLPNPPDFSLFSYSFLSPRSDKTLQDIVYKLVPGLFKGTSMDDYNCVGLGLFVTRSHPPVKLVPWGWGR